MNLRLSLEDYKNVYRNPINQELKELSIAVEMLNTLSTELNSSDTISNEGLMSFFRNIGDIVIGISKTAFAILSKFGKRSEFEYWYDKNTLTARNVESRDFFSITDLKVDVPTGMEVSYFEAINQINAVTKVIDIFKIVEECKKISDRVLISISNSSTEHAVLAKEYAKSSDGMVKTYSKSFNILQSMFNDKAQTLEKKPLSKVISNGKQLKECRETLLSMRGNITSMKSLHGELDEVNKSVGLTIAFLEKTQNVQLLNKTFLSDLSSYYRNVATLCELYGTSVVRQAAVEHNLILVYSAVYNHVEVSQ